MRTKLLLFLLLSIIFTSVQAQEYFNEYGLFLNSDESVQASRFNPAVLGIKHKSSFALNAFYDRIEKKFKGADVLFSSGGFASGYYFYDLENRRNLNNYFLGFGFGNKITSGGFGFDFLNENTGKSGTRISAAFMFRPAKFLSVSSVYRFSLKEWTKENFYRDIFYTGIGIRPPGTSRYNLYVDYWNRFANGDKGVNVGVAVKLIKGLTLNASFRKQFKFEKSQFMTLGLNLDFGNIGLKFNTINKKLNKYDFQGSVISFDYTREERENLNPPRSKNIEINISGDMQDYSTPPSFFGLLGKGRKSYHHLISSIDDASKDKSVKGILLYINPIDNSRFGFSGAVEEIGNALKRFKGTGKKIVAYIPQGAGISEYFLATYADKIVLPREASINYGLSLDVINYRQFLAKFGINMEVFSAGKYKLTFQGMLDSTTEEGKEVINRILDLNYEYSLERVREGRKLTLTNYIKKMLSRICNPRELRENKLIDEIGWYEDAKKLLSNLTGTDNLGKGYRVNKWNDDWYLPPKIAVIGVYSTITSEESTAPPVFDIPLPFLSQDRTTGSKTVVRQLTDAFSNSSVKAVILRVNSGGGSALGSAEIYDAISRLKKKYPKPFIVSMGDVAGSGGYYVSACADKIFANKTTVTGSIGVLGASMKIDSLMKMLNIKAENFKRGEYSDMYSLYVPLDDESKEIIKQQILFIYDEFINDVSKGRKLSREETEKVAQGRVWLGSDAMDKKLVDEIGGLIDAIKYAKLKSGIKRINDIELVYYPVAGNTIELDISSAGILEMISDGIIKYLGFEE